MEKLEEFEELVRTMIKDEPAKWTMFSTEYEGRSVTGEKRCKEPRRWYVRMSIDPQDLIPGDVLTFECGEKTTVDGEPAVIPACFFDGIWNPNDRRILSIRMMAVNGHPEDIKSEFCRAVREFLDTKNLYEVRSEFGY